MPPECAPSFRQVELKVKSSFHIPESELFSRPQSYLDFTA
ncbi:hypothetical protein BOO71_0008263 [Deinococcus marmoris]|uniref:Uncharacterized protein n=1 Tax=Deinococcus marmoris TaxID=249408 RepID=A0A1U7NXD4_9DEIO|nr:hypothetical protein BOO71_0008263 [Deinococcus marmoris]